MKQLTEKQAIKFANSGVWKNWTPEQIVEFQLFQELLCMPFGDFHEAVEIVLKRPVWTHEFASKGIEKEYLKLKPAPSFDEIINLIPENKRVLIFTDDEI
jgi:hypothetical protein